MRNHKMKLLIFSVIVSVSIFGLLGCQKTEDSKKDFTSVRIGWQIPLATQGQIVQVLKQTDLLENYGLKANFIPFSYGGPQSEAALANELDVIFVGDQPAINLIARGGKWKIVSRLFYTKTAIMVPMNSTIRKIEDLRGKTVASPFGSVSHREAILKEQAAGLNADKDVNNINIDILEISSVVQSGGDKSWGKIDAVGVWEPSTSLFEANKLARIVDYTRTLGVVAISDDFMAKHPEETVQFLRVILKAWAYFASHTDQVNQWYIKDAKLSYTPEILKMAAAVEPNYNAKSIKDIDIDLTEEHIKTLEQGAEWSFERGFSKNKPQMLQAVDTSFLSKAKKVEINSSKIRMKEGK